MDLQILKLKQEAGLEDMIIDRSGRNYDEILISENELKDFISKIRQESIEYEKERILAHIAKKKVGERPPDWKGDNDPQWWDNCSNGYNQALEGLEEFLRTKK